MTKTWQSWLVQSKQLQRQYTLIENQVLDITDFVSKHPGGHVIQACVGIDATALFATHHPFSGDHAREWFDSLRIGTCDEGVPRSAFYTTLTAALDPKGWPAQRQWYERWMQVKACVLVLALSITWWYHAHGSRRATIIWPWLYYMFAASAMHEAGHFSSQLSWFNRAIQLIAQCVGAGGTPRWIYKHLRHHAITNHPDDPELNLTEWVPLKADSKIHWYHRWLPYYTGILYSLLHIDIFIENCQPQPSHVKGIPTHLSPADRVWSYLSVCMVIIVHVILPTSLGGGWQACAGLMVAFIPASLFTVLLFQVSHVTKTIDHEQPVGVKTGVHHDWAVQQIRNCVNYSVDNIWMTQLYGGLNYQLEHHLFPTIPHTAYPAMAPTVRRTCKEMNVPYQAHSSLLSAVRDHWALLVQRSLRVRT